jgi:molecular chaperone Hsp33
MTAPDSPGSSDPAAAGDLASDEVVRCVLQDLPVRIVAATTTAAVREAVRRHQAGPVATVALSRGLTAGLLLATLTKDDERVTLQILGDGPLGGVTVDATAAGSARAYVKHPGGGLKLLAGGRPSLAAAVGQVGLVNVIRDVGLRETFSGQIALATGEIDEDVEAYLEKSEQVVSALACDALWAPNGALDFAAGILVQALPGSEGAALVAEARAFLAGGEFLRALAGARRDGEGVVAAVLGDRLGKVQVLDRRPVRFDCPCSRARAGSSLALLGEAELAAMILDDGKAEVTCNFCRAHYQFDEAELEIIRRETAKPTGPPS